MLKRRRLVSRAVPAGARVASFVFPRVFLLLESGDRLLLEGGDRIILE